MTKYTVAQINAQTSYIKNNPRRSVTVTEDRVNAIRDWMNRRMRQVPAESSDWISVQPA
jgi:hypothetical protein